MQNDKRIEHKVMLQKWNLIYTILTFSEMHYL